MNDHFLHTVQEYYNQNSNDEWRRLERHRMEFAVTMKALLEYLPSPPGRILDCGGGPGRYAIELAKRGYAVCLFDLSPGNLELARQKATEAGVTIDSYEQGSAIDLSRFAGQSFDAVLLFGPLYHLLEESDRMQALREARRVLKPGGPLFCTFISRYAAHRDLAYKSPADLSKKAELYRHILETGHILPQSPDQPEFIGYLSTPVEVGPFVHSAGLDVHQVLGVEGLNYTNEEEVNQLSGEEWQAWVDLNYQLASDPSILGSVAHLLVVARNPLWKAVLIRIAMRLEEAGIPFRVAGGASVVLNGVPLLVKDIDIETSKEGAYRFQELFGKAATQPAGFSEGPLYRSVFGRYDFDGVGVDVMGDLQRREGDAWIPTATQTETRADLEGVSIPVSWLEEETLAYIRRGRLDRAAQCLPYCDSARLLSLLRRQVPTQVI